MIEMIHCVIKLVRYQTCTVSPNYPHLLLMFHTQNGHQSRFFWPRHQPAAVCLQRPALDQSLWFGSSSSSSGTEPASLPTNVTAPLVRYQGLIESCVWTWRFYFLFFLSYFCRDFNRHRTFASSLPKPKPNLIPILILKPSPNPKNDLWPSRASQYLFFPKTSSLCRWSSLCSM